MYRQRIDEKNRILELWVRRKRGNRNLECFGCGRKFADAYDSNERAVRDLAWSEFRIRRMTGTSSAIVFEPLPEDDPRQRKPDIAKARALLGWEPRVPLEDGLRHTVEYFRGIHAVAR